MKKSSIEFKKYDFKWKNITPVKIGDKVEVTDVYYELVMCGSSGGVAIKAIDGDQNSWVVFDKSTDGYPIRDVKSAKILKPDSSIFTSGDGYFIKNGNEITKKTAGNSPLPSNVINKITTFSSFEGREVSSIFICTDKGLYNRLINDESSSVTITVNNGLPSDNVIDFAINNTCCMFVTDRGLATSTSELILAGIKASMITNINFIKNNEFLFVATEVDFNVKAKTCFVVASSNKVGISYDNGDTWDNITPPNLGGRKITCIAVDDSTVYIGTNDGLFISHKNKKIWYHYSKEDGLTGGGITDISIDVQDGKAIVVSTESGVSQGEFFDWSISTIPEVAEIFCLVNVTDGPLETKGVFFAGTDKGLYKSSDDCKTWVNIYNKHAVISLASSPFLNGTLFVGTAGDGLFIYKSATRISEKTAPFYKYTTDNGLESNWVSVICPWNKSALSQKIFIGYYESKVTSYIDAYNESFYPFDPSLNNLPLGEHYSIKILNNRLYVCTNDYEAQGAFLAISKDELTPGVSSKDISFEIVLQNKGTAVVEDVERVGNDIYVTSMDYDNSGLATGFTAVNIRFASEGDLTHWNYLEGNEFYGDGYMASDNGILYINELHSLCCYDKKADEQKTYPKPESKLQPAPLIKNNVIYIVMDNSIYYSDVTSFY